MADKVDQVILGIGPDVSEAELAASVHNCTIDEWIERKRVFAAGRQQGLREAAEVALSHMTCGCDGKHGYCSADSPPKAIAAAITALMEGEGKWG